MQEELSPDTDTALTGDLTETGTGERDDLTEKFSPVREKAKRVAKEKASFARPFRAPSVSPPSKAEREIQGQKEGAEPERAHVAVQTVGQADSSEGGETVRMDTVDTTDPWAHLISHSSAETLPREGPPHTSHTGTHSPPRGGGGGETSPSRGPHVKIQRRTPPSSGVELVMKAEEDESRHNLATSESLAAPIRLLAGVVLKATDDRDPNVIWVPMLDAEGETQAGRVHMEVSPGHSSSGIDDSDSPAPYDSTKEAEDSSASQIRYVECCVCVYVCQSEKSEISQIRYVGG